MSVIISKNLFWKSVQGYIKAICLLTCFLSAFFLNTLLAEANPSDAPPFEQLVGDWIGTSTVARGDPEQGYEIGKSVTVNLTIEVGADGQGTVAGHLRTDFEIPIRYNRNNNRAEGSLEWFRDSKVKSEGYFYYNNGEIKYEETVYVLIVESDETGEQDDIVHGFAPIQYYAVSGKVFLEDGSLVIEGEDANLDYFLRKTGGILIVDDANELSDDSSLPSPVADSPVIPPSDDYDSVIPPYDLTPDGLSKIPLPENAGQAMAGLLIPGILSIILGILGQSGAAVAPSGGSGSSKAKAGTAYDFGDGRDYYEGQSYTFDNGKKYKIDNGEFVATAGLKDGEGYTDPDGNRKIWIGGQAWHESDWRRQAATNDAYSRAHKQDVDSYWDKRQQEIHEEQAALHEKDEAEKAKDREIEAEREKIKELIRKTIEIQMDIDRTRRDIANRSAKLADRAYRTAEAIKYVCDKSIDIAAKIPGPKGEAFKAIRKAYRVTSAMAGGVGEGMASGNWTDSMVDATGAAVSNLIEDSIKTDRYKKGFEVFRGGTGEAWQQGRKAYKKGESIAGAAAIGFVEGAASEASKKAKEALEEFAPGSKYSYTIGESSFKAGYKEYKKGGDIGEVMRASGSGYVDGGVDAVMDFGVGKIFDNILPENVSEKTLADHIKYVEELEEQGIWMELYDTNRFPELKEMLKEDFTPEIIYDEIRKEANKVTTKATQNVVKGKQFDDKLFT